MPKFSIDSARKRAKAVNTKIAKMIHSDSEAKSIYQRKKQEIALSLRMRKIREKLHLSQDEVAKRMKTSRTAISRLESCGSGKHSPSIDTLIRYVEALGCKLNISISKN